MIYAISLSLYTRTNSKNSRCGGRFPVVLPLLFDEINAKDFYCVLIIN
jgi:hypothetical protein